MDQEEGQTAVDNIVTQFSTYEDFLDSQITTVDLYYLEAFSARSGLPRILGGCTGAHSLRLPTLPDCTKEQKTESYQGKRQHQPRVFGVILASGSTNSHPTLLIQRAPQFLLRDETLARQLVELGYRGTGEIVKREDFEARKAAIEIARLAERTQKK
ncbi:hypothetical protein TREES_T100007718 [Tupaia chinensis]|uniref:Cilia- and flagella-associated protein 299 n=1 Tax=Tupaia chinensis TaxID=246437 RepID=L9KRV1_TUPCH|nr:hypothetical protein TREES_T100007718 [Tupaia chinensis]